MYNYFMLMLTEYFFFQGVYISSTDSEDLPIKVGDKILQVDGIDVGNMGVDIVLKILGNCQENIQLLVSRQK